MSDICNSTDPFDRASMHSNGSHTNDNNNNNSESHHNPLWGDNNSNHSGPLSPAEARSRNNNGVIDKPLPNDVLCGKDKTFLLHEGNLTFRQLIADHTDDYIACGNDKHKKMKITKRIVDELQLVHRARFLKPAAKKHNKREDVEATKWQYTWSEISDQLARDKVSHALRFAASQRVENQQIQQFDNGNQSSGSSNCSRSNSPKLDFIPAAAAEPYAAYGEYDEAGTPPLHHRVTSDTTCVHSNGRSTTAAAAAAGGDRTGNSNHKNRREYYSDGDGTGTSSPKTKSSNYNDNTANLLEVDAIFLRQQAILTQFQKQDRRRNSTHAGPSSPINGKATIPMQASATVSFPASSSSAAPPSTSLIRQEGNILFQERAGENLSYMGGNPMAAAPPVVAPAPVGKVTSNSNKSMEEPAFDSMPSRDLDPLMVEMASVDRMGSSMYSFLSSALLRSCDDDDLAGMMAQQEQAQLQEQQQQQQPHSPNRLTVEPPPLLGMEWEKEAVAMDLS